MKIDDIYKNPYDKTAHDIYSLYFIGWLFGFLAFIIGGMWASWQMKKNNAPVLYRSHYQFQMMTAIYGYLVLLVFVFIFIFCLPYTSGLLKALLITFGIVMPLFWWLKRCISGYKLLKSDKTILNPKTFLWPKS